MSFQNYNIFQNFNSGGGSSKANLGVGSFGMAPMRENSASKY